MTIDDDDEHPTKKKQKVKLEWGSKARNYYEEDSDVESAYASDDDRQEGEASELLARKQSRLSARDLGIDDILAAARSAPAPHSIEQGLQEVLFSVEGAPQNDKVVCPPLGTDSPELIPLLRDAKRLIVEILAENSSSNPSCLTDKGQAYMELKMPLQMFYVCQAMYYVLLKLNNVDTSTHGVTSRLVKIRSLLEKLKPVDQTLKSQVNELLAARELEEQSSHDVAPEAYLPTTNGAHHPTKPASHTSHEHLPKHRILVSRASVRSSGVGSDMRRLKVQQRVAQQEAASVKDLQPGGAEDEAQVSLHGNSLGIYLDQASSVVKASAAREAVNRDPERLVRHREKAVRTKFDANLERRIAEAGSRHSTPVREANQRIDVDDYDFGEAKIEMERTVDGKRATSNAILKNKGLTRQRKKTDGNARVANRLKFDKKVKKLKTMQRQFKEASSSGIYDGDSAVKGSNFSRSIKFK
eukprot:GHVN01077137.1.p1 GENE.GHVN01077137.1~~GHVN01077137.1.p1  ORF type:complete len:470 (+),score=78.86 GHVN01077137.1:205-1614(+)